MSRMQPLTEPDHNSITFLEFKSTQRYLLLLSVQFWLNALCADSLWFCPVPTQRFPRTHAARAQMEGRGSLRLLGLCAALPSQQTITYPAIFLKVRNVYSKQGKHATVTDRTICCAHQVLNVKVKSPYQPPHARSQGSLSRGGPGRNKGTLCTEVLLSQHFTSLAEKIWRHKSDGTTFTGGGGGCNSQSSLRSYILFNVLPEDPL